jgi:endonuclease/exonuclease/phosphatase family metal-dependent hydrolase
MLDQIDRYWDKLSHLIIMGDFNDAPHGSVRKLINQNLPFLSDPWKNFNEKEETSHHGFKGKEENGARIDWILVPNKLQVEKLIMDKSHHEGKYPSDHFPIVCQIKL